MKKILLFLVFLTFVFYPKFSSAQNCVECHKKITPNIVSDWQVSKHAINDVDCSVCHGDQHKTAVDFRKALIPTPETCSACHSDQVVQYKKGKHAMAWVSMNSMPTIHMQPMEFIEGKKGCGSCHKIGLKSPEDIQTLYMEGSNFGNASCDACHTRHTFSKEEAKQPQACQTCHMGFDHPQWEMYSNSKHGVRYLLKQMGKLPESVSAPTCQDCHMSGGNHEVRTAWGFLALRLPMPEDKQWSEDRATILKALGVLDPDGKPTGRLDLVKKADLVRITQKAWQTERDKMIMICGECHSKDFAKTELEKGDAMIMQADNLMAAAIKIVAGLYEGGILQKPKDYVFAYPDLLTFHDASSVIEQKLFVMFLEHRMRTFQGMFHANPDYAFWYGWSELNMDLTEITELADQMRKNKSSR